MSKESDTVANESRRGGKEPSKRQLERQLERTRESLAETVGEIKETVDQQVESVKQTVSGVLDYREQFQKEPLVWSLGALSAGFAIGYTVGYAHKNTKGAKQSPLVAFADTMVDELSTVSQSLVIPALDVKIKELFGFNFSELLREMRGAKKGRQKRSSVKRATSKRASKRGKKKGSR